MPLLMDYVLLMGVLLACRTGLRFSNMEHPDKWVTYHFLGVKENRDKSLLAPCLAATASNKGT